MLKVLLVLQTNPKARLLYSNTPVRLRRQLPVPPPAPSVEFGAPPICGELPELGRLMGRGLDWALMEGPRGL
jgi:hypothetical protein